MAGVTLEKMSAMEDSGNAVPRIIQMGDLLDEWEADAEAAHEARASGNVRGPVTAIPSVDRQLNGALAPGVHVVHASPGVGKTALCLQIAATCQCPALYLSAEMAPLELLRRTVARVTSTFLGRLRTGELTPTESMALARKGVSAVPLLAIGDGTRAYADPSWILTMAEAIKEEHRHVLIVVDSAHSWSRGSQFDVPEYERLGFAVAGLQRIAAVLACPVLVIAERNRASMQSGGMSAAAGNRLFEYGAETVMELQREKDAQPDGNGEVPIQLVLSKNRNGAGGAEIDLLFHGALQRFREAGDR